MQGVRQLQPLLLRARDVSLIQLPNPLGFE